jgi:hypothetical protein
MMKTLLKTKMLRNSLVVTGLLIGGTLFAQTTINNGQTINASGITANTAITIASGGTLNMDVTRSFSNITTTGTGTSTIAGAGTLTVNNTITQASNNTLSIAPVVIATSWASSISNNQSATLTGAGTLRAGTVTITVGNFNTGTLVIGNGLTVEAGTISGAGGNGSTDQNLTVGGHLKISNTLNGIDGVTCNIGSTVEFDGGNQAIPGITYDNLILSGTGTKTISGDRTLTGNFTLETGVALSLGGNDITISTNSARTATINGTLSLNGSGRLLKNNSANKTLVLGPAGRLNLTYQGMGAVAEMPVFGTYNFASTSTVNYGSNGSQDIVDIAAPGYGHLIVSGSGGTKTAEGALDIQGDFTLTSSTFESGNFNHQLKGSWFKNGGTFNTGSNNNNRITFSGAAAQTIGGTQATTFRNITFNNTAGGITLAQPTTVNTAATFTNGVVSSSATNVLIFTDNATSSLLASNASTPSYVNGPVRKIGNDAFVFPIGGATGFVPLAISAPDNTADALQAQYFRGIPTDHEDITAAGIVRLSTCDYWTISEINDVSPATNVTVTFYWNANNPCTGANRYITNPASIKAVRYSGTSWTTASAGVGTGAPAAGQVIFANVSAFNQFALGSTSIEENPLPVVFGDVKAYEKNNGVQVEWSNLTEKDVALYTIERSSNGRDFSAIGTQLPSSNQDDKASYVGFDAAPNSGANYYRIKAAETTGKIVYSKILTVNTGKSEAGFRLYPNPVSGHQVTVSLSGIKQGAYNVRVVNATGQDIFRKAINAQGSGLTQTLDLPTTIKAGVYNLVITGDSYRATKTFIVQ